jgi:hypothetical protein
MPDDPTEFPDIHIPNPTNPRDVVDTLPTHPIAPDVPLTGKVDTAKKKKKSGLVIALALYAGWKYLEHRDRRRR